MLAQQSAEHGRAKSSRWLALPLFRQRTPKQRAADTPDVCYGWQALLRSRRVIRCPLDWEKRANMGVVSAASGIALRLHSGYTDIGILH